MDQYGSPPPRTLTLWIWGPHHMLLTLSFTLIPVTKRVCQTKRAYPPSSSWTGKWWLTNGVLGTACLFSNKANCGFKKSPLKVVISSLHQWTRTCQTQASKVPARKGWTPFAICIYHGSHQCKIIFGAPFLSFCVSLLLQDWHFSGRTWWWSITGWLFRPKLSIPIFVDEIIIMPLCNYSMLESPLKAMYRWCPRKNGHRSVIKKKTWLLVKLGGLLLIWLYSAPQEDRT